MAHRYEAIDVSSDAPDKSSLLAMSSQVRASVRALVNALDAIDRDRRGLLLRNVTPSEVHEAAITVMMRILFVAVAEGLGLLPVADPAYGRLSQAELLRELHKNTLPGTCGAWSRLVLLWRSLHRGRQQSNLRPRGGLLFDPDRFPFLEGRVDNDTPRPLPISDLQVAALLQSVIAPQQDSGSLGPDLLGHLFEELLDGHVVRPQGAILCLRGASGAKREVALEELEARAGIGDAELLSLLKERTQREVGALRKRLGTKASKTSFDALLAACDEDEGLSRRIAPYAGLLDKNPDGSPAIVAPGRLHLTLGVGRRAAGAHYTPRPITQVVVQEVLQPLVKDASLANELRTPEEILALRVCDPAMGSGAFLLEVCRYLGDKLAQSWAAHGSPAPMDAAEAQLLARRLVAVGCLRGVDKSWLAVEMAKLSLWLLTSSSEQPFTFMDHALKEGDSLLGAVNESPVEVVDSHGAAGKPLHWPMEFAERFSGTEVGFDAIVGNPPWIAYAGRASQPLSPELRAYYSRWFDSFRGYPTLHGLFVERCATLAPRGRIGLVLPSPVADLDGYAAVRRVLTRTHRLREPMMEFGQDAFEGVTQPCFAMLAEPREAQMGEERSWVLRERQRAQGSAQVVSVPAVLEELLRAPSFPDGLFGEMGFQSAGGVRRDLMREGADATHTYPLLEGKDVVEFAQAPPRLFLAPDQDALRKARCNLRKAADYAKVKLVVRQTAAYPIAALHGGLPFRNSLLAGFDCDGLEPALVVGLLNSVLYRALHVAARRDVRQATFPQVKVRHLRALPRPPEDDERRARVTTIAERATRDGMNPQVRGELDHAVFELFRLSEASRGKVIEFLGSRVPKLRAG